MKVNKKTEYALRAVLYLSSKKADTKVMAKEISESMSIPKQFLAQIMVCLSQAGLVTPIRGAKGGFILAKKPSSISILDVIEAAEGKMFVNDCLVSKESCNCEKQCPVSDVWKDAQKAFMNVLEKSTFSILAKRAKQTDGFIDLLKTTNAYCKPVYVDQKK